MINLLTSLPSKKLDAFWTEVDSVSEDTVISMYNDNGKQSWSYDGAHVVKLPELAIGDIMAFMNIHKILLSITDSFHNVNLHVFNDYYGVTVNTLKPYQFTFLDEFDESYVNKNIKHDYVIKEENIINKVIILNDHIETLFEVDVPFDEAYLLTKSADTLTLVALNYMLKGLPSTIDADYYFDMVKLITCDPYTLFKVKRVELK